MTPCFTTRGPAAAPRTGYAGAPRIHSQGNAQPPSVRHGIRWRALPVAGSAAHRRQSGGIIRRIFKLP